MSSDGDDLDDLLDSALHDFRLAEQIASKTSNATTSDSRSTNTANLVPQSAGTPNPDPQHPEPSLLTIPPPLLSASADSSEEGNVGKFEPDANSTYLPHTLQSQLVEEKEGEGRKSPIPEVSAIEDASEKLNYQADSFAERKKTHAELFDEHVEKSKRSLLLSESYEGSDHLDSYLNTQNVKEKIEGVGKESAGLGLGVGLPSRKPRRKQHAAGVVAGDKGNTSEETIFSDPGSKSKGVDIRSEKKNQSQEECYPADRKGKAVSSRESEKVEPQNARLSAVELLARQTKETVGGIGKDVEKNVGGKVKTKDKEKKKIEADEREDDVLEEEMMRNLMKQLEDMGSEDMNDVMDVVMKQLLSREVLEQPMRQLYARYPSWLSENATKLAPAELERYSRQREAIGRLCELYAERGEDYEAIFACMGEMQACGQPPQEMIAEIAPGLEIGQDGLPILPELQQGDLQKDCTIM